VEERGIELTTSSPAETLTMARAFAGPCRPGEVVGLCGTLGAGKTLFVKGLAAGLGVADVRQVVSPTFVLMRSYPARLTLYHFDAYRLASEAEMDALGCQETFASGGVSAIEWADHVAGCLPPEHLMLSICVEGETRRRFTLECHGAGSAWRVAEFGAALARWRVSP